MEASIDQREQSVHLVVARSSGLLEPHNPVLPDTDAVEDECMDVDVQIERGHDRKHVVDEVRRSLRHAARAAAGTHRPALARKRHQAIQAAPAAVKPGEPARQKPTAQESAKLLLDEPRQRVPFVDTCGRGAERLVMIADHLIQHTVRG
jgi:hypothetical protein